MPSPSDTARALERRVAIVEEIARRRRAGIRPPFTRELAALFDVGDRTIRVDLHTLAALGVLTTDGSPGGIVLHEDKLEALRARIDAKPVAAP